MSLRLMIWHNNFKKQKSNSKKLDLSKYPLLKEDLMPQFSNSTKFKTNN